MQATHKVADFYNYVERQYSKETAEKFLRLMKEWDGGRNDVSLSFYTIDLLKMKLEEALEQG